MESSPAEHPPLVNPLELQKIITCQQSAICDLRNQLGLLTSQVEALQQLCNDRFDKVGTLLKSLS